MVTFLLATRNPKKGIELSRLLRGVPVRFLTLDRFPDVPPVVEDGSTFRANAVKKAVRTSRHTIVPVIADDSGLEVRALDGRPGVRSARFAGPRCDDDANNEKLLRLLQPLSEKKRKARFVCCIAVAIGGRLVRTFEGMCEGSITLRPSGRNGFGYDPIFVPAGSRRTMAEMPPARKDRISHRGTAAARLKDWLRKNL